MHTIIAELLLESSFLLTESAEVRIFNSNPTRNANDYPQARAMVSQYVQHQAQAKTQKLCHQDTYCPEFSLYPDISRLLFHNLNQILIDLSKLLIALNFLCLFGTNSRL
jgi:hypothetical protein